MIIRRLKASQYDRLKQVLAAQAQAQPRLLDASYTVPLSVNGAEYAVKLLPDRHNQVAVLQALRVVREKEELHVALITEGGLLTAFLELLLYQEVGR